MKAGIFLLLAMGLCACASAPITRDVDALFADKLFAADSTPRDARDVFALSAPMLDYIAGPVTRRMRAQGPQLGLYETLRDDLRLEYDTALTRTAAETFEARTGNCLSLVILTAALARQLDIPIHYQSVYGYDTWSRVNGITFLSGHINVVLGARRVQNTPRNQGEPDAVTIDFLPSREVWALSSREIAEATVVAMYMNNRAAETLAAGDVDGAYWWAREAIRTSPSFLNSYNTLGVIYRRHDALREAERVLRHAQEQEPDNAQVLTNLSIVLADRGLTAESQALLQRLARLQPVPPFHFLDLGKAAMARGDAKTARDLFKKELARLPYDPEVHLAMAIANFQLGELRKAEKHLGIAQKNSTSRDRRELYAAKLDRLKALQTRQ